jgi:hypothetical protein
MGFDIAEVTYDEYRFPPETTERPIWLNPNSPLAFAMCGRSRA